MEHDHLPLAQAYQNNNVPLNDPQVYRQLTEIGRFTKDIRHVSGVDNIFADFLSRIRKEQKGDAYLEDSELNQDTILDLKAREVAASETLQFQLTSLSTIAELQGSCPEIELIRGGDKPKNTSFADKVVDGQSVFCEVTSGIRPYILEPLRQQVMRSLHALDHVGIKSSIKRIADEYYWPALKHDVKKSVKICDTCMKVKAGKKLTNTSSAYRADRPAIRQAEASVFPSFFSQLKS